MNKPNAPLPEEYDTPPPAYNAIPPPQYSLQPPVVNQPTTAVTQNIILLQPLTFGPKSMSLTCPHCSSSVTTNVVTRASLKTHLIAIILCLFCWPCSPCPYCVDDCLVKRHYCPVCKTFLGEYDG